MSSRRKRAHARREQASGTHRAGGIVGGGAGMWLNDVYAVGNVTGRGSVGGLIGQATCDGTSEWVLYRGIYRGNVTDANLGPPGGWAGTLGHATDLSCDSRTTLLYFNKDLDTSTSFLAVDQRPSTTSELIKPTAPTVANGGIFVRQVFRSFRVVTSRSRRRPGTSARAPKIAF